MLWLKKHVIDRICYCFIHETDIVHICIHSSQFHFNLETLQHCNANSNSFLLFTVFCRDIENLISKFLVIRHFVYFLFFVWNSYFFFQNWRQMHLPVHRHHPLQAFHSKVLYNYCYIICWKFLFLCVEAVVLLEFLLSSIYFCKIVV